MNTNTVQDLLDTVNPDRPGITCPACGSILSIRKQGTYNMILTENARLELDGSITNYRSFLEGIEDVIEHLNIYGVSPIRTRYPYKREPSDRPTMKVGGIHQGTLGSQAIAQYMINLDYFEWVKIFYSVKRKSELDNLLKKPEGSQEEIEKKTCHDLKEKFIDGLEPQSLSGPLMDLIFEQKFVAEWMKKYSNRRDEINTLLEEVCPSIQWYLTKLMALDEKNNKTPEKLLQEGVFRVQFVLAILLGHKSQANLATVADLGIKRNVCFILPRVTIVSPKQFSKLLCAEVVLSNPNLGWERKFVEAMRQENADTSENSSFSDVNQPTNKGSSNTIDKIVRELGPQVTKFVHFACNGPGSALSTTPKEKEDSELDPVQKPESTKCGWYPKREKTHSVILLGSPGTGKSTVMLTGLTAFYNYVGGMGATISFDAPGDEAQMKQLNAQYWAGNMPSPTKEGWRQSIKLALEFPADQYETTNFVFTDIPGEIAARSLTEEGSDPAVLRILKNAETVIFFFDLSIEPCIREKLINGDEENVWKMMQENYKDIAKSRKNRVEVSQLQLLQKLLQDLRYQKGNRLKETKFICVIPKSDLFVNEDSSEQYFLTGFFQFLQEQWLLVSSRHYQGDSFAGLYSMMGTGSKMDKNQNIEDQKEIARQISKKAIDSLKNIGNALGNDSSINPLKMALNRVLKVRLLDNLFRAFGEENVYFLPVSAQGENSKIPEASEQENNGCVQLGHPPNQKLSEYVFVLPVALCAERIPNQKEQRDKQ